jgi:hypothetical protein
MKQKNNVHNRSYYWNSWTYNLHLDSYLRTVLEAYICISQRIFYDVFDDSRQWPMSRGRACTPLRRGAMR